VIGAAPPASNGGASGATCEALVQCSLCEHQEHCGLDGAEHSGWLIGHRLGAVKHRVLVLSNKGGVGKSTVAVNLAVALAEHGLRVGLADADLTGPNVPHLLGLDGTRVRLGPDGLQPPEPVPGLRVFSLGFLMGADDPLLVRDSMKQEFLAQLLGGVAWGELDILLVDMPPGTGGELIGMAELDGGLDGCVMVTTPHVLARADARRTVSALAETGVRLLGVVENMASLRCGHCGGDVALFGGGEAARPAPDAPVLGRVPLDPQAADAAERGEPVVGVAGSAAGAALRAAAAALAGRLGLESRA
jgi:ATP-binding protein involved in chromosome partitioning